MKIQFSFVSFLLATLMLSIACGGGASDDGVREVVEAPVPVAEVNPESTIGLTKMVGNTSLTHSHIAPFQYNGQDNVGNVAASGNTLSFYLANKFGVMYSSVNETIYTSNSIDRIRTFDNSRLLVIEKTGNKVTLIDSGINTMYSVVTSGTPTDAILVSGVSTEYLVVTQSDGNMSVYSSTGEILSTISTGDSNPVSINPIGVDGVTGAIAVVTGTSTIKFFTMNEGLADIFVSASGTITVGSQVTDVVFYTDTNMSARMMAFTIPGINQTHVYKHSSGTVFSHFNTISDTSFPSSVSAFDLSSNGNTEIITSNEVDTKIYTLQGGSFALNNSVDKLTSLSSSDINLDGYGDAYGLNSDNKPTSFINNTGANTISVTGAWSQPSVLMRVGQSYVYEITTTIDNPNISEFQYNIASDNTYFEVISSKSFIGGLSAQFTISATAKGEGSFVVSAGDGRSYDNWTAAFSILDQNDPPTSVSAGADVSHIIGHSFTRVGTSVDTDTVSYIWSIDSTDIGSGNTLSYSPTVSSAIVTLSASDGINTAQTDSFVLTGVTCKVTSFSPIVYNGTIRSTQLEINGSGFTSDLSDDATYAVVEFFPPSGDSYTVSPSSITDSKITIDIPITTTPGTYNFSVSRLGGAYTFGGSGTFVVSDN